jgi:secondary thiamine-phosphate synthase enzyme
MTTFYQKEIKLKPYKRGFHLITDHVLAAIPEIKNLGVGTLHVFIKHTSASITINENFDPTVRADFEAHFNAIVPENAPYYQHNYEGPDDMPGHLKSSILGNSLQIPITEGKLNLGRWQGIYLGEHRNYDTGRKLVITAWGSSK